MSILKGTAKGLRSKACLALCDKGLSQRKRLMQYVVYAIIARLRILRHLFWEAIKFKGLCAGVKRKFGFSLE